MIRRDCIVLSLLAAITTFTSIGCLADDGAASIGAGGIIVMKREDRIAMAKEVLTIGLNKVKVDYEFRNDTDDDIATTVAFPIPPYEQAWDEHSISEQGFDDFKLTVEGRPIHFQVEARAKLKGRDVTEVLWKYGVDVATFGHFSSDTHHANDIRRLSAEQRNSLARSGLIVAEKDQDEASWTVEKKYYWSQVFPPHSTVHISHEYTPVAGSSNNTYWFESSTDADFLALESTEGARSFCAEPGLLKTLKPLSERKDRILPLNYVDFILTTANTWKRPIEDFTLIVERPHDKRALQTFVSFCWEGTVTKLDNDHFSAHVVNLIPARELHIGFISVYPWDNKY